MDFKTEAIPLGLLLNIFTSSSAAFTYIRKKLVNWEIAIPISITMTISAAVGSVVNLYVSTKLLLIIFAVLTGAAAILILIGKKPEGKEFSSKTRLIICLVSGAFFGFFAGLIGKAGGVFVVPHLYILGIEPRIIAGTSAITAIFASTSRFITHLATASSPQWAIWALCAVSVFAGSQLGSRVMAKNLPTRYIKIIFAGVLLLITAKLTLQALSL